jgi:hypothetical protein
MMPDQRSLIKSSTEISACSRIDFNVFGAIIFWVWTGTVNDSILYRVIEIMMAATNMNFFKPGFT